MGFYLNSSRPSSLYRNETKRPYFVDKTRMLKELFPLVEAGTQYICITRPRRFGKTITANMIGAFFGKGALVPFFDQLEIAREDGFHRHKNQHNVIYIPFNETPQNTKTYTAYINRIADKLRKDLQYAYPDCEIDDAEDLWDALNIIHERYQNERFLFVLDEWDFIFHRDYSTREDQESFLSFLSTLLKDQPYVELAYMTGILPIASPTAYGTLESYDSIVDASDESLQAVFPADASYSSGSELNMFKEFTMSTQHMYGTYFGFTESEVDMLYQRYLRTTEYPAVTREGLRSWYDGYCVRQEKKPAEAMSEDDRLYNPRSVVFALENNQLADYWTSSGPYDEIFYYVKHNIADVRNDLALMLAGESVSANIQEYSATSLNIRTRDEVLSAMVVYGFLTCKDGKVRIPNRELMNKFAAMVKKESSLGYIHRLALESERMMCATQSGDTATMTSILKQAHDTETGMQGYNDETELSAIIRLIYLSARDRYDIQREDKAGVGYVDYIFYPVLDQSDDCIILELKVNHTAAEAIQQIKDRNYMQRFIGKLGEQLPYRGRILAVGIAYFKDDKQKRHECKVEILRDKQ